MSQPTSSAASDPRNPHQMPLHRKVTYSFTDLSGNLLYCIISTYALYYFTEVYGLSMAVAGTILLVARFFDAFDAPIWGVIIDHTHTKWGQSRPWFLWMAVPFSLFVFLLFCAPPIGDTTARAWYAGVVYVLAGISYTGMSAPITSVLPNLTSNPDERNVASTFRMVGGNVGNFLAVTFILPLATKLGGSSTSANGWRLAVGLYCLVALVLLVVAFLDMREQNIERTKPISIRQSFKAAKGNWPWILVVVANVIFWIGFTSRTSMLPYYFRYNVGNESWTSILNHYSGAGHDECAVPVQAPAPVGYHPACARIRRCRSDWSGAYRRLHAGHDRFLVCRLPWYRYPVLAVRADGHLFRGLRRMEERHSRGRSADGHRLLLLHQDGLRHRRVPAVADPACLRLL